MKCTHYWTVTSECPKCLRAELDKAQRHIEMLQAKLDAEKSCACAYDDPNEVCLPHSPLLEKARAENEQLREQIYESIPKWQANELQREINQLRDAMQFYADPNRYKSTSVHMCGHSTGASVMIDGGRKAREALEVKS